MSNKDNVLNNMQYHYPSVHQPGLPLAISIQQRIGVLNNQRATHIELVKDKFIQGAVESLLRKFPTANETSARIDIVDFFTVAFDSSEPAENIKEQAAKAAGTLLSTPFAEDYSEQSSTQKKIDRVSEFLVKNIPVLPENPSLGSANNALIAFTGKLHKLGISTNSTRLGM